MTQDLGDGLPPGDSKEDAAAPQTPSKADPHPTTPREGRFKPRQRILQHEGKRRSLRLERVFWDYLTAMARTRGLRLGALVEEIARSYTGPNLASELRVRCMLDLERQLLSRRQDQKGKGADTIDWAPVPCVFLSESGAVLGGNQAYHAFIGEGADTFLGRRFSEVFRVQTASSFQAFWENVASRPQRPLSAHIALVQPGRVIPAQATFCSEVNHRGEFVGAKVWLRTAQPGKHE